ncbi:hypothetical protein MPC4_200020 [Methylocella tundrae]|uniref:Uncharacterized protein n=1 Tax=Methylocella tundrae TaxID=227605 RepID=A0A8B6M5N2_METTU|nr:hypothetical protein MPC4_200020 [Methylocella tundrae]
MIALNTLIGAGRHNRIATAKAKLWQNALGRKAGAFLRRRAPSHEVVPFWTEARLVGP